MLKSVIVYAKRTPIGKLSGTLSSLSAPELSSPLISDLLKVTGIEPQLVEECILGQVLTAGVGQAPARQASRKGGLPDSVCATTVGRVCGSGLKAVMLADQAIRCGDASVIVAGGQESMSQAPHLLPRSREGYKFGSVELKDSMQFDGLWDPYDQVPMGQCGELCASTYQFSRLAQDEYAKESYSRARIAIEKGWFNQEILPLTVKGRREDINVSKDEEPFSVDLDKLSSLRPAFAKDGTITAGNASSINDGAAVLLILEEKRAKELGLKPLARILGQASFAHEPKWFTTAPVFAMRKLMNKIGMQTSEIDLFEINEAFSNVAMAAIKDLKLRPDQVNPSGGAVALGHPIGCSGARILVTLIHALNRLGRKTGVASLCIGGGEASAIAIETI